MNIKIIRWPRAHRNDHFGSRCIHRIGSVALASAICWIHANAGACAQQLIWKVSGDQKYSGLGVIQAAGGDINADGYPDVLVGLPGASLGSSVPGAVRVYSGKDGTLLYLIYGSTDGEFFGASVASVGDVDKDGYADFLVGAPLAPFGSAQRATIYSGRDVSILWSADGDSSSDYFGSRVANCGDINHDGIADFAVAATSATQAGKMVGFVRAFSAVDGSTLFTVFGSEDGALFGAALSGAGDIDADGYDDILVGSPFSSHGRSYGGRAQVYSGKDASLILDLDGTLQDGLLFGYSVSAAGDLDLDGFDDFLVGSNVFISDSCPNPEGFAWAYSGRTGSVLYSYQGDALDDIFGFSLHGCGDVNSDGWPDFIIGAPQTPNSGGGSGNCGGPGYARLYSGHTGAAFYTFTGTSLGSVFGWVVSDAGDENLDGFQDISVGAQLADDAGTDHGSIYVFGGNDLFLSASSRSPMSGDVLTLSTREGLAGNAAALYLVDVNGTPMITLLSLGSFDSGLGFNLVGTVPPGLTGNVLTFESFAIGASGKVIASAPEVVRIQ